MADTTQFPSYYMAFLHVYTGIECCQRHLLTAGFLHSFKDSKILLENPSDLQGVSLSFRNAGHQMGTHKESVPLGLRMPEFMGLAYMELLEGPQALLSLESRFNIKVIQIFSDSGTQLAPPSLGRRRASSRKSWPGFGQSKTTPLISSLETSQKGRSL